MVRGTLSVRLWRKRRSKCWNSKQIGYFYALFWTARAIPNWEHEARTVLRTIRYPRFTPVFQRASLRMRKKPKEMCPRINTYAIRETTAGLHGFSRFIFLFLDGAHIFTSYHSYSIVQPSLTQDILHLPLLKRIFNYPNGLFQIHTNYKRVIAKILLELLSWTIIMAVVWVLLL